MSSQQRDITWHKRWIDIALEVSKWSKDPSTQTGAVIVTTGNDIVQIGCNGFPRKVADTMERFTNRDLKLKIIKHAEENAIDNCARTGVSTKGCIIYATHFPCPKCAGNIIQAGIFSIFVRRDGIDPGFVARWGADIELTKTILAEAGVFIEEV